MSITGEIVRPAAEVHAALLGALKRLAEAEECAVLHFAEILRRRLYRELGHGSIHAYAECELGFSRSKTFQFIQLAEAMDRLPALRGAVESGELPWTKAVSVARVATARSEARWLNEAQNSSRRELEVKVRHSRARTRSQGSSDQPSLIPVLGACDQGSHGGRHLACSCDAAQNAAKAERCTNEGALRPEPMPAAPVSVGLRFEPEQYARLQALMERLRKLGRRESREELLLEALDLLAGAGGEVHDESSRESSRLDSPAPYQIIISRCEVCGKASYSDGRPVPESQREAAECDARMQGGDGSSRATIPPRLRRRILARDGHRCAMPGCGHTRFLEVHHLRARADGGTNDEANLLSLCSSCHRLVHEKPDLLRRLRTGHEARAAQSRRHDT